MKYVSLFIEQTGKGRPSPTWKKEKSINIQRLYYIKSGTGYVVDEDGKKTPFVPGNIYLFPYNFQQNFVTQADDLLNHLYIDFVSTPPILSHEILIYPVGEHTPLRSMVELLDGLFEERLYDKCDEVELATRFEKISDAPAGSRQEYFQTLYTLIQGLLMLLSGQREIPFSSDEVVADALKIIHRTYNQPINIGHLAEKYSFHINHFMRRFKAVMGISPYAYLRNYRLYRARELLSNGATLAQAAEQVGYENATSLSRALREK